MKRFAAILLFTLLLANAAGFYAFYFVQLKQIKSAMRELVRTLPREKLEVITLDIEKYEQALVEDEELEWQGKMYDIQNASFNGSTVTVYCLHDVEEDNLLATINTLLTRKIDQEKIPTVVVAFITLEYQVPSNDFFFDNYFKLLGKSSALKFLSSSPSLTIATPPPQCA